MTRPRRILPGRRQGLATLEMVLALPLLLMIMAVIVNIGTVAAWKVRTLVVSRHQAWSTRWPRGVHDEPRAENWPTSGNMSAGGDDDIMELDDGRLEQPVVRGPLSNGAAVDPDMYELMTLSHGAREGHADIRRQFPLLASLGTYHLQAHCPLLDNDWRYQRLPGDDFYWHWGGEHNELRRIPIIYDLGLITPQTDLVESLYQSAAFRNAYFAMAGGVDWNALKPLGGMDAYGNALRDDEDLFYQNHFPPYPVPPGPFGRHLGNMVPRFRRGCTLDEDTILDRVDQLIERIEGSDDVRGVPERLARAYQGLYRAAGNRYDRQWPNDPPPLGSEQQDLNKKSDELETFLDSL